MFLSEMYSLWEQYLAFIRYYGDHLPSVFNPMPYLPAREVRCLVYRQALVSDQFREAKNKLQIKWMNER